jgi:hypothetical protein
MTQGIQPMVWHQFEDVDEGTIIRFSIISDTSLLIVSNI